MNNNIYCSTGTVIGRANNFDYKKILEIAQHLVSDAFELMMLEAYYEKMSDIPRDFKRAGLRFPVTHADKFIGELISRGSAEDLAEAERRFKLNCRLASSIDSKRLVLHLWGGRESDKNISRNIEFCENLLEIAQKNSLKFSIENVPCVVADPITHWEILAEKYPEIEFIFDTRFGGFHKQLDQIFKGNLFNSGRLNHMHVSDFTGPPLDFTTLRPILQPGEGIIDFDSFFAKVKNVYNGSITLESPVLSPDGSLDIITLNNSIEYIRKKVST